MRIRIVFLMCVALASGGLAPSSAQAMGRNTKTLFKMGAYGVVGGTVLGLATYPFTHKARNIFIGSSIGLYLGLAMGLFYIANDYNVEEPFPGQERTEFRAPEPASFGSLARADSQNEKPALLLEARVLSF